MEHPESGFVPNAFGQMTDLLLRGLLWGPPGHLEPVVFSLLSQKTKNIVLSAHHLHAILVLPESANRSDCSSAS